MNNTNSVIYYVLAFVISIIITWVVLSLILLWVRPVLFNANGTVNWWTTLWVSALLVIFVWLVVVILKWIFAALAGNCRKDDCYVKKDPCAKPDPCPKPDPCDPCAKTPNNYYGGNA